MKTNWKKNIIIFMSTQILSIFGSSLVQFAITWYITLKTNSGVSAMLIIVCSFAPSILLSPFAGVWADRYNKKILIALADGLIAVCTLVVALLFMSGHDAPWILYIAAAFRSLGSAVQGPSVNAIIPELVPENQLTRVNGINGSLQSLITLISPMLSAALIATTDIENIFFIDVGTAAIAIFIMLFFLRIPADIKAKPINPNSNYLDEMKAGLTYINKRSYLKNMFGFIAIFCFMAAPVAFLTPLQVIRTYGEEIWKITAIEVAFSVGMLLGGLLLSLWGGFKNRVHTMIIFVALMGITTIGMGFAPWFIIYLIMMGLCGFSMPMFNTAGFVILQERVDPAYMGRVFSILSIINMSIMPLGMLVFGPLADYILIEWILIGTGIILTLLSLLLYKNKALMSVGVSPLESEDEVTVNINTK